MEDPERICDECEKHSGCCKWLKKTKTRSACVQCAEKRIKCKIDGIPVSNRAPRRVGSSNKRRCLTTPEVLESATDTRGIQKASKTPGREQAQWGMAHTLEDLVWEQSLLWESAVQQEELLEDLVSNTKVIADAMDLFIWGERFLRVREMGRLEGPEGNEMVVRRHRMMGEEKESEGVLEVELEASCDVEMTLQ